MAPRNESREGARLIQDERAAQSQMQKFKIRNFWLQLTSIREPPLASMAGEILPQNLGKGIILAIICTAISPKPIEISRNNGDFVGVTF